MNASLTKIFNVSLIFILLFQFSCSRLAYYGTNYASGFSEIKFNLISKGMPIANVYKELGVPLDGDITWKTGDKMYFPEKIRDLSLDNVAKLSLSNDVELILHYSKPKTTNSDKYKAFEIWIRQEAVFDKKHYFYED